MRNPGLFTKVKKNYILRHILLIFERSLADTWTKVLCGLWTGDISGYHTVDICGYGPGRASQTCGAVSTGQYRKMVQYSTVEEVILQNSAE